MKHFALNPYTSLLALMISSASALADETVASPGDTQLQTVKVEAARTVDAQQPPASTRTLSGKTLEQQRIYRLQDLQQVASGLDIATVNSYDTRVTIRGVGDGGGSEINIGMPSSVGLFLDNVYLSRPGMLSNDLLDIDSANVFSGPQGTLFGYNTTGGAIDIHSRQPTFTPQGSVRQSLGSHGFTQTQGMLSGPLGDGWAGRINLSHTERGGTVENIETGHELGGSIQDGFRGQLLYKPDDDFSLRLIADYNQASNNPVLVLDSTHAINGVDTYRNRASALGADVVTGGRKVALDDESSAKVQQGGVSAEANWRLGDGYNLRSVTSFRYFGFKPKTADNLDVPLYSDSGADVHDRTWSQSLRLDSPRGEFFDYALGASYFGENLDTYAHDHYAAVYPTIYYGNTTNTNKLVQRFGELNDQVFSLWAQGTWHLTDKFDVTAGARETYDQKSGSFRRVNKSDFDSGELHQYSRLPAAMVNFSYQLLPNVQTYLTVAYGEKAGGLNVSSGAAAKAGTGSLYIEPETTKGAELGFKSHWLDNRVTLDTAVFWSQVSKFQTTAYDLESQSSYLINAGTMRSRGVETTLGLKPLDGLSIDLNATVLDNKYLDFKNATCPPAISLAAGAPATCDETGQQVFRSPKLTYSLNTRYQWTALDNLQAFAAGRWSYRTWAFGTVDDSAFTRIPGYGLLGLSTGLSGKYGDGRWNASLWVNNALNKRYYVTMTAGDYGSAFGVLGDPRTLGVTLGYDF